MSRPTSGLHNVPWGLRILAALLLMGAGLGIGVTMVHKDNPSNRNGLMGLIYGKEEKTPPPAGGRDYTDEERAACRQYGNVVATLKYDATKKRWLSQTDLSHGDRVSSAQVRGKISLAPFDEDRHTVTWTVTDSQTVVCELQAQTSHSGLRKPGSLKIYTANGGYTAPPDYQVDEVKVLGYVSSGGKGDGLPLPSRR